MREGKTLGMWIVYVGNSEDLGSCIHIGFASRLRTRARGLNTDLIYPAVKQRRSSVTDGEAPGH